MALSVPGQALLLEKVLKLYLDVSKYHAQFNFNMVVYICRVVCI